jgi:hypothetical protein
VEVIIAVQVTLGQVEQRVKETAVGHSSSPSAVVEVVALLEMVGALQETQLEVEVVEPRGRIVVEQHFNWRVAVEVEHTLERHQVPFRLVVV